MSLQAQHQLGKTMMATGKTLERLSSGLRINSAADDAAGLAISQRFTAQIRGLDQAMRNGNDGISLVQTAEGALDETSNILQRIRELAVQSANDTNTASDRAALQDEVTQLLAEVDRIATATEFNGAKVLDGSFTDRQFQIGANQGQTIKISIGDARASALGNRLTTEGSRASVSNGAVDNGTRGITEDGVVTPSTVVTAGDVVINGVDIASATNGGDLALNPSAGANSDGMKAVAERINQVVSGVTASAKTTFKASDITANDTAAATAGGAVAGGTLAAGDLTINGVQIGAVTFGANDSTGKLVDAINAATSQTGVTASVDSSGVLSLTADDGRDIVISTQNGAASKVFGMGSGKDVTNLRVRGELTLEAKSAVTISGAQLSDVGLDSLVQNNAQGSNLAQVDISTVSGANAALSIVDAALEDISSTRATLGATQNRLTSTLANLGTTVENLSAARSRILDA
ncbi:MAG: flagellin, partial [Planctomycetota bacterium]